MSNQCFVHMLSTILVISTIFLLLAIFKMPFEPLIHYRPSIAKRRNISSRINEEEMITCQNPNFDPFDKIALAFYEKIETKFKCNGFPSFIIPNLGGILTINESLLYERHQAKEEDLDCYYQTLKRNEKDEFDFVGCKAIKFNQPILEEFLYIECKKNKTLILDDLVALPPTNIDIEDRKGEWTFNSKVHNKLNVLIIGIDSISRLNSMRHFQETRHFLKGLNAIELKMYNKVGDNSFPNQMALLTGIKTSNFNKKIFYDDVDFIWKNYSREGYYTLFIEDMVRYATFSTDGAKGFKKKPVDFYFRPLSIAIDLFASHFFDKNSDCYRDKLKFEFYWNYIKLFTRSGVSPYFAFTFLADFVHNDMNYAGYLDKPLLSFFEHLFSSGGLQNTVLLFFSDHGIRYGGLRATYMGHREENMPIAFLVFPKWFYDKYPKFYQNLKINQDRLTTHFDVHQTFRHILSLSSNENYLLSHPYGQSLFELVPLTRTCKDAGIDAIWCSCHTFQFVNTTENFILKFAEASVNKINDILKPFANVCHLLKLGEIVESKAYAEEESKVILIIFKTVPGNGTFEATASYNMQNGTLFIQDPINRISSYKNTFICVSHKPYINYCYCK